MLRKLAFIAIVFNQFEFGLECLRRSKGLGVDDRVRADLEGLSYYSFLRDLEEGAARMPAVFPSTFASTYTFEASRARFEGGKEGDIKSGPVYRIKGIARRIPILFHLCKVLNKSRIRALSVAMGLVARARKVTNGVTRGGEVYSDVEKVLIGYGLQAQAEALRDRRILQ